MRNARDTVLMSVIGEFLLNFFCRVGEEDIVFMVRQLHALPSSSSSLNLFVISVILRNSRRADSCCPNTRRFSCKI